MLERAMKGTVVLWLVFGALMLLNTVALSSWRLGVGAASLFAVAGLQELLRRHWDGQVKLDGRTAVLAAGAVAALGAGAVVLSGLS